MRKILAELVIRARDQNKVFVEKADARKLGPMDAAQKYRLGRGKGNAYVEFDIEEAILKSRYNPSIRAAEMYIDGDVDLTERNVEAFFNF